MNKITYSDRYVIVADIVGFKKIIEKENKNVVDAIIDNFFEFIKKENMLFNQIEKYGIISDTIYFVFNENVDISKVLYCAFCLTIRMPSIMIQGGISKGEITICEYDGNTIIMGNAFINAHNFTEKYPIGMYLDYKNIFGKDALYCMNNDLVPNYIEYYLFSLPNYQNEELLYLNFAKNKHFKIIDLYQYLESLHTYYLNANEEQKIRKFIICFLILHYIDYLDIVVNKEKLELYEEMKSCPK